jgi:hypothetical protein
MAKKIIKTNSLKAITVKSKDQKSKDKTTVKSKKKTIQKKSKK